MILRFSNTGSNWSIDNGFATFDTGNSFLDGVDAIVFELTFNVAGNNDLLRVWFDADPNTMPPSFSTQAVDFGFATTRVSVSLQTSDTFGGSTLAFDELRVGTTVADVVVPEPSSLALIAIGLAAAFGLPSWRRRAV